jgi:hypothetical protein
LVQRISNDSYAWKDWFDTEQRNQHAPVEEVSSDEFMTELDGDSDGIPENDLWNRKLNFWMVFLNIFLFIFSIFNIFLAFILFFFFFFNIHYSKKK